MSAGLIVDLFQTAVIVPSVVGQPAMSGLTSPASGALIGGVCDLIHANTATQLACFGVTTSGPYVVQIQTSDTTTSGSFTDPTSGLAQLPGAFQSGGLLWISSGGTAGTNGWLGAGSSGQFATSGFGTGSLFQRPHRYARANLLSGFLGNGASWFGFIAQAKTTGSGGGSTQLPGSGTPSV